MTSLMPHQHTSRFHGSRPTRSSIAYWGLYSNLRDTATATQQTMAFTGNQTIAHAVTADHHEVSPRPIAKEISWPVLTGIDMGVL